MAIYGQIQSTRLRRKKLIAAAYQTALSRVEVLYRIRRRTAQKTLAEQDAISIRDTMHDVQTRTDYYVGLLWTESTWFGRSYEMLIEGIKNQTEPLMQKAWDDKAVGPGVKLKNVPHPDVTTYKQDFLKDVRDFFNPILRAKRSIQYHFGGKENNG